MTQFASPSKLKAFRACPRRCFEEPYTENPAAQFGTGVHEGAAAIGRFQAQDLDAAVAVFKAWIEKKAPDLLTPDNVERATAALNNILTHPRVALSPDLVLDVESSDANRTFGDKSKKYHEVAITGTWGLSGSMDLVDMRPDGTIRVLDWKTGQSEEVDDIQTACYALMAERLYKELFEMSGRIETAYFYAEKGDGGYYDGTFWNVESLRAAHDYVGGLVRDYLEERRQKTHPETMNKNCGYCALRNSCATYQARTQVMPAGSAWDTPATVEAFPVLIARLEEIGAIKKAVESIESELIKRRNAVLRENPVINADGRTFTRTEKVCRYHYPAQVMFNEAARLLGEPPLAAIEWDATAADALIAKKFPARGAQEKKDWAAFVKAHRTVKSMSQGMKVTISKVVETTAQAEELHAPALEPAAGFLEPVLEGGVTA